MIGQGSDIKFNKAEFLAGSDDKLFVSDSRSSKVQIFDLEGNYLDEFGEFGEDAGEFNAASGIAVQGDQLYVGDKKL